jgi:hypothetical protein
MKKYKVQIFIFLVVVLLFLCTANDLSAQCPMCKMSAESNLKNGGTMGRGLNSGILYMLSAPYICVGVLAYLWMKNRKKVAEDDTISPDANLFSEN